MRSMVEGARHARAALRMTLRPWPSPSTAYGSPPPRAGEEHL